MSLGPWPECLPCIEKMARGAAAIALVDEERVERFAEEVRVLVQSAYDSDDSSAPELVVHVWSRLVELSGDPDPLQEMKARQNAEALALLPAARTLVAEASDPLGAALRLAIGGNALDAMVGVEADAGTSFLAAVLAQALSEEAIAEFRARVMAARRLVYVTDNCGEVVFDRLLLEVIQAARPAEDALEVTFVTRTVPALNDATPAEARVAGLDQVGRIVENGIREPLPGTAMGLVSPEVRALLDEADMVVSKGVGNYELLADEPSLRGRASFLLQGKCDPICRLHDTPRGSLVLRNA